jgi:hypothetical protein
MSIRKYKLFLEKEIKISNLEKFFQKILGDSTIGGGG